MFMFYNDGILSDVVTFGRWECADMDTNYVRLKLKYSEREYHRAPRRDQSTSGSHYGTLIPTEEPARIISDSALSNWGKRQMPPCNTHTAEQTAVFFTLYHRNMFIPAYREMQWIPRDPQFLRILKSTDSDASLHDYSFISSVAPKWDGLRCSDSRGREFITARAGCSPSSVLHTNMLASRSEPYCDFTISRTSRL